GLFPLRFGNDSFKPHLAAARATKKPCVVLTLPGIALDVDCPSDLQQPAAAPGDTRAQRLAREWELLDLALVANQYPTRFSLCGPLLLSRDRNQPMDLSKPATERLPTLKI